MIGSYVGVVCAQ